jgi:hypothetical protein
MNVVIWRRKNISSRTYMLLYLYKITWFFEGESDAIFRCGVTNTHLLELGFESRHLSQIELVNKVNLLNFRLRQITKFKKVCEAFWLFGFINKLKGLKPKNKDHTNFYECCDLTKKVYLMYLNCTIYLYFSPLFVASAAHYLPDQVFAASGKKRQVSWR